jgi:hypothetical protein
VRDPESGKPLVWDIERGRPVPYDAGGTGAVALEGEWHANTVSAQPARPAFGLLRDHVRQFTPEWVESISTTDRARWTRWWSRRT